MQRTQLAVVMAALWVAGCGGDLLTAEGREAQVNDHMESLRSDPAALKAFLHDMPKGGDLHNHT